MNAPSFPAIQSDRLPLAPARPEEPVLPLSVEAYHVLLNAGVLQDGDPVELLEGFLVPKMTKGPRHEAARRRLRRLLEKLISAEYFVDEQGALTTATSEPEPDIFVIRGTLEDFEDRHAEPAEVALVVEIADSSVRRDRTWKKRVYGAAGVPCYWVVNLVDDCVEVYAHPTGLTENPGYASPTLFRAREEIAVVIDGKEIGRISASEILGQR